MPTPPTADGGRAAAERDLAAAAARGLAGLTLGQELKDRALHEIRRWLADEPFRADRAQLSRLIEKGKWAQLLDSFYRVLPFGTGGRRGPVGIGPNRFNPYTLECSVQGNAEHLRARHPGEALSVVLAFDTRQFHDLRGRYDPAAPSPLRGITSREFARLAAQVYAGNGVRVYMPEGSDRFLSTPELSFSIRRLNATGGLNVSASHNHPDDNGGKFYNRAGAQPVPPEDEEMARRVDRVARISSLDLTAAKEKGLVLALPPEIHEAYIALNLAQSLRPDAREAHVVFTPLHGTGLSTVGEVLVRAGFRVDVVAEQATADGAFPAVPYRAPNPEVEEAMEAGVALAKRLGADVVLACDPDADRIGVCSRSSGGAAFRFLTGNEIAALVTHGKLRQLSELGRLPKTPLVIKTEVTTDLLAPITKKFGGTLIGDLLVGFKYHAEVLDGIERRGEARGVRATLSDFIAGVEESHGVLVTPQIRDKDAAGAALLLAEQASLEKRRGRTLSDALDDLYREFGYHGNLVVSMGMMGAEGLADIQRIQEGLRARPPAQIGGLTVTKAVDHWDESGIHGRFRSETDRVSRNVLVFRLENGARVTMRPSGTEPKSKTYVEVPAPALGLSATSEALARQKAQTDATARRIADDFTRQTLAIIGVELPDYALRISGLVPLDRRLDFVQAFLPELARRAHALREGRERADETSAWIDGHLGSYGADGRRLVGEAMRQFLAQARARVADGKSSTPSPSAEDLDAMESLFFPAARPRP